MSYLNYVIAAYAVFVDRAAAGTSSPPRLQHRRELRARAPAARWPRAGRAPRKQRTENCADEPDPPPPPAVLVVALVVAAALAATLVALALQRNIAYLYTPSRSAARRSRPRHGERVPPRRHGRGRVRSARAAARWKRISASPTAMRELPVVYTGILPDLFREKQAVVATGRMQRRHLRRRGGAGQARRDLHAEGSRRQDGHGAQEARRAGMRSERSGAQ